MIELLGATTTFATESRFLLNDVSVGLNRQSQIRVIDAIGIFVVGMASRMTSMTSASLDKEARVGYAERLQ